AGMRWEALFDDLSAQLAAAELEETEATVAELTDAEAGTTALTDRLRARRGLSLRLRLRNGDDVEGTVVDVAAQWVLLGTGPRRTLVPVGAVQAAWSLGVVAPQAGEVERRLGMTHVLRAL